MIIFIKSDIRFHKIVSVCMRLISQLAYDKNNILLIELLETFSQSFQNENYSIHSRLLSQKKDDRLHN